MGDQHEETGPGGASRSASRSRARKINIEGAEPEKDNTDDGSNPSPDAAVKEGPADSEEEPAPAPAESSEQTSGELAVEEGAADADDEADEAEAEDEADEDEDEAEEEAEPEEPAEPSAEELVAKAQAETAKAQAEVKEWQDKYLRLQASWDTYRRRTNEEREAEKALATEKLVTSLLPVIDDFERAIAYAETNGEGELLEGVKAVHSKLLDALKGEGVEVINPVGEAFDAMEHQAVATVPNADVPDESVGEVYQPGYKMGRKVLRPAMVTVTTGGPKRPKEKTDDE